MSLKTSNQQFWAEYQSYNTFNEVNKTVTFQADIYTNYNGFLKIYSYAGSYIVASTTVPANIHDTYSITTIIPNNATVIRYRVEPRDYIHNDSFCYTDNWRLIFQ